MSRRVHHDPRPTSTATGPIGVDLGTSRPFPWVSTILVGLLAGGVAAELVAAAAVTL